MKLAQALFIDFCVVGGICIVGYAIGGLVGLGIAGFGSGLALAIGASSEGDEQ